MKKLIILGIGALFGACSQSSTEKEAHKTQHELPEFVEQLNQHHQYAAFQSAGVFSADILLTFGGKQRLDAKMLYDTQTQETALYHSDGKKLVFTQDTVWLSPDTASYPKARFDIFTWSYFMALPHKLNDEGLHFKEFPHKELEGKSYATQHLSFSNEVGDAPDDWYVLYQDTTSGLLHAAAYIVTLNKDKATAEQDPHAIVYKDYQLVDGIPISTRWEFYGWRKEKGLTQKLGEASLSNLQFLKRSEALFQLPANKKEVKL
ncbi:hypothetical protein SAMN05216474_1347 [Lishizhenia tianjinensis]|uniref:Outer membrane lipoprotein-sorting protein n=1 Tax=Lishizhenia tianjinensis TaxID=477690 RepID=A0A1I6Z129_9FLAO|nr:hypothetical protein [Lishizhenia tianjinensis]SFT56394.1 hypothetical protein SAMN05216474_1347 [Lishizhenia tianjinensis]